MSTARIVVVRHALNADQPSGADEPSNPPLCDIGRSQAQLLARNIAFHLPTDGPVLVRHSHALCATETAEIIAQYFGAETTPDKDLQDRTWDSPVDQEAWLQAYSETLKGTLRTHPSLILVTHQNLMKTLFAHLPSVVGLPPTHDAPPKKTLGIAHGFLVTHEIQHAVPISF
jgi:phosphohistidine phosphatase SixA